MPKLLAVEEIHTQLPANLAFYQFNDDINLPVFKDSKDLQTLMTQVPRDPPPADKIKKPDHHDELLYIYTSGTTGLVAPFNLNYVFLTIFDLPQTSQSRCHYSFPIHLHRISYSQSRRFLGQRHLLQPTSTLSHCRRLYVNRTNVDFRFDCCHSQEILGIGLLLRLC